MSTPVPHRLGTAAVLAFVTLFVASCSSEVDKAAAPTSPSVSAATTASSTPSGPEDIRNPRSASIGFLADLDAGVWTNNIDSPMIEAQLICERLDRGMSVDAVVEETLSAIKSSDAYWNTAHNHIFSDMSEDHAEYMLHDTVAGLCPEHKAATGTVS